MSLIDEKYEILAPQAKYLTDTVVLSQAWKKTHAYIRKHNWYADVLELDCSTINLERQLKKWSEELTSETFSPRQARLVPAPKNARWEFVEVSPSKSEDIVDLSLDYDISVSDSHAPFNAWCSATNENGEREQKLRPLAHLNIRDQTLATSVMLCLAEAVESAQGDTSEKDFLKAGRGGVFSYGNRLHCSWHHDARLSRASFSWGNSRIYGEYFQDYRRFLARPLFICQQFASRLAYNRELFVLSLDIKSFFDHIDRDALIGQFKVIYNDYVAKFGLPDKFNSDEDFWTLVARIFSWKWNPEDKDKARLFGDSSELPKGLPQGLVSSGFFANAYLAPFDQLIGEYIDKMPDNHSDIIVRDYCRYVDDIRLVVEAPLQKFHSLARDLQGFVQEKLQEHCEQIGAKIELTLNDGKTSVTPYRSLSAQSNLSALMELFQEVLSGTPDLESLAQAVGGLDGLLGFSDQMVSDKERGKSQLALANITVPKADVRDDTVKRFVATRIVKALRMGLAMTDIDNVYEEETLIGNKRHSGYTIEHEFEATARKLIKSWADNPSLALLLRCGLDLFPHPRLLIPVTDALCAKLFSKRSDDDINEWREELAAEYVAADLLRAGSVETGYRTPEEYPRSADIPKYRQELAAFARRILNDRASSPWYLMQQAALFLASIGDHGVKLPRVSELKLYRDLHFAMLYKPVKMKYMKTRLPLALIGQQLAPNIDRLAEWFAECLSGDVAESEIQDAVLTLSLNRPDLMQATLRTRAGKNAIWRKYVPKSIQTTIRLVTKQVRKINNESIPLILLIHGPYNDFTQENALLTLLDALLCFKDIEKELSSGLHVGEIKVRCKDWDWIQHLPEDESFLSVELVRQDEVDQIYANPDWVRDEMAWLYGLGRVLRSCITGEFDFTANNVLVSEEVTQYQGLRTTWFGRRFGLLNNSRGLLDEPGPVSPWMSDLLMCLLQWPGIELGTAKIGWLDGLKTKADLMDMLNTRVKEQRKLFGKLSGTPVYVMPTHYRREPEARNMRVAIVQPMLPRSEDFNEKDPTTWSRTLMARHRGHLAEVCRLTHQKLRAWASAQGRGKDESQYLEPIVDLIVFPELSIHPEHLSVLRGLSDTLRASIFAGLTFMKPIGHAAAINQALWLIRTETSSGGRTIQYAWQGKKHLTAIEKKMGIKPYRPYQLLVEFPIGNGLPTRVAGSICYDATDLALVADLREVSDMFVVAALNQDVLTFDNMVAALNFHMYQPVVLANSGEFGGSTAQAPFPKHERLIAHAHGNNQIAVSVFEIDPSLFKTKTKIKSPKELKSPPAGYRGRPPESS